MRIQLILPDAAGAIGSEAQSDCMAVSAVAAIDSLRVIDRRYAPAICLSRSNGIINSIGKDDIAFAFFQENARGATSGDEDLRTNVVNIVFLHKTKTAAV